MCVAALDGFDPLDFFHHCEPEDWMKLKQEEFEFIKAVAARATAAGSERRTASASSSGAVETPGASVSRSLEKMVNRTPLVVWDATGEGPRRATKRLQAEFEGGMNRQKWLAKARAAAILGSCPSPYPVSGVDCVAGLRLRSRC